MDFILYQTNIIRKNDFNPHDFALRETLPFSYCIWFAHGEIPFLNFHINRIQSSLQKFNIPDQKLNLNDMERQLLRLMNKNKAYMGGWINLTLYIAHPEIFLVATLKTHPERHLPLSDQGAMARISDIPLGPATQLSFYQPLLQARSLIEHFSGQNNRSNPAILCHENGCVVQTPDANIFAIKGNSLYTPALATGCINDPLRSVILVSSRKAGLDIEEKEEIFPTDLEMMDELFVASEKLGFVWIQGLNNKRFIRKKTVVIREMAERVMWPARYS